MGSFSRLIGGLLTGKLTGLRHGRNPSHVRACPECASALRRERQYLERLRNASVPAASDDLVERLLEGTHRLAGVSADRMAQAVASTRSGPRRSMMILGSAAGGVLLMSAALAVSAYVVAGDPLPRAGEDRTGVPGIGPAAAGLIAGATPAPSAGTSQLPTPVPATRTRTLSSSELASLSAQGWSCPQLLERLGFQFEGAQVSETGKSTVVELQLGNGEHHAAVREEHFHNSAIQVGAGRLTIAQESPWKAVYASPEGTIALTSDLPMEQAELAVQDLVRAGESMDVRDGPIPAESLPERLQRGLETIAGLPGF